MIVMEFVDGKTLSKSEMDSGDAGNVRLQIKAALKLLHDNGLVFGDLCPPNVMIIARKVNLIDFNWAGEQGRAKYPCLLSNHIRWPANVETLAVIKVEHDLQMLSDMFMSLEPVTEELEEVETGGESVVISD